MESEAYFCLYTKPFMMMVRPTDTYKFIEVQWRCVIAKAGQLQSKETMSAQMIDVKLHFLLHLDFNNDICHVVIKDHTVCC